MEILCGTSLYRQIVIRIEMSSTFYCQRLTGLYRASSHALPSHVLQPVNATYPQCYRTYATTDNLPRVAQPSVWQSIIPKAFRNPEQSRVPAKPQRRKEWNPATFFICVFLLIGSNAIQTLALKNEYSTFSRKTDAKIKLLKDVLDRVQRGEDVDVEKALGTGDEVQEQEWKNGKLPSSTFTKNHGKLTCQCQCCVTSRRKRKCGNPRNAKIGKSGRRTCRKPKEMMLRKSPNRKLEVMLRQKVRNLQRNPLSSQTSIESTEQGSQTLRLPSKLLTSRQ